MMKKTIIASMVLVTSLLATPVMAENNFGVDLESMSLEDLISLKDAVNEQIAAKGGDNVFGAGVYEVGKDIKAASFKLICYEGTELTDVFIYENEDAMTSNEPIFRDYLNYDDKKTSQEETPDSAMLNLKENQVVVIKCGMATIEETKPSWAPEE